MQPFSPPASTLTDPHAQIATPPRSESSRSGQSVTLDDNGLRELEEMLRHFQDNPSNIDRALLEGKIEAYRAVLMDIPLDRLDSYGQSSLDHLLCAIEAVRITTTDYSSYDPVDCLNVLKDVRSFLRAFLGIEVTPTKIQLSVEFGGRCPADMTENDLEMVLKKAQEKDEQQVRRIQSDPIGFSRIFRDRRKAEGDSTSFNNIEEHGYSFEYSVTTLLCLCAKIKILLNRNPETISAFLAHQLEDAERALVVARGNGYPYRPTIDAIEKMAQAIDIYQRGTRQIKEPLYHSRRWRYHTNAMKKNEDYFLLITPLKANFKDLMVLRAASIGIVGIEKDAYADGHAQSMLEFLLHDMNHSRRALEEANKGCIAFDPTADRISDTDDAYAKSCQSFLTKFFDHFKKLTNVEIEKEVAKVPKDQKEELRGEMKAQRAINRLAHVILFELIHEDALPADPKVLLKSLLRPPGGEAPFRYERQVVKGDRIEIVYDQGESATTLAFVFRKIWGHFYDQTESRTLGIGPNKDRTETNVTEAGLQLVKFICEQIPESEIKIADEEKLREILRKYTEDDTGLPADILTVSTRISAQRETSDPPSDPSGRGRQAQPLRYGTKSEIPDLNKAIWGLTSLG